MLYAMCIKYGIHGFVQCKETHNAVLSYEIEIWLNVKMKKIIVILVEFRSRKNFSLCENVRRGEGSAFIWPFFLFSFDFIMY